MSLISESSLIGNNNRPSAVFESQNTYDSNRRSDYEKRLQEVQMERSSYDKSIGFRTPEIINNVTANEQQFSPKDANNIAPLAQKIHPSIISMFLKMDESKREILKRTQFQLYQSILSELNTNSNLEKIMSEINNQDDLSSQNGSVINKAYEITDNNYIEDKYKGIIDIDFRNDLVDCNDYVYTISIPGGAKYNIVKLSLSGIITINQCYNIENEPYIYLSIANIKGNHENSVFGKLVLKKIVNGFIIYAPENAVKEFKIPITLNKLDIALLNHQYKKIILNRIPILKIKKTDSFLILTSATKHYLCIDDRINMFDLSVKNNICSYVFTILEIDGNNFTVSAPNDCMANILKGKPDLVFEKVNIKVSMSFNYENIK